MKLELRDYTKEANIRFGKLFTFEIEMVPFPDRRQRTIRVWLPGGYDGVRRYPVLYMHDAQNLFDGAGEVESKWYVDREMQKLESEGIQVIVVGIDTSVDRGSELFPPHTPNPEHRIPRMPGAPEPTPKGHYYADFVEQTLKPIIDENFMTLTDAANTGVGGASMGGLQSFYMTMRRPEVFGRSLVFSPGFSILDRSCLSLIDEYDMERLRDVRIFSYTGDQTLDESILYPAVTVYRKLRERGLDYMHSTLVVDCREPHYMTAWNKYFAEAVRYLFSEDNSVPMPPPRSYQIPESGR